MPSSTTLTFVDRAWDVKVFVATRGEFEAKLTKIDLHRLWIKRGWLFPPFVAYNAGHKTRNAIFFLTEAQQAPIFHDGIETSPGDIVYGSPGHENHLWTCPGLVDG